MSNALKAEHLQGAKVAKTLGARQRLSEDIAVLVDLVAFCSCPHYKSQSI